MGRFRVRLGEAEVEYEGEDSADRYTDAIEWVEGHSNTVPPRKDSTAAKTKLDSQTRAPERPSEASLEGFELPSKGKLGKIEFSADGLKFPPSSFEGLTLDEAIGLLLYELGKPVRPAIITALLTKGWRKANPNNVRSRLTSKGSSYILAKYVVKEGDGYRLTGQGNEWVKTTVAAKLGSADS